MDLLYKAPATAGTAPGYGRTNEEFDMSDPMPEQWRPVVGYEGRYEVSDLGRVRSLHRWVTRKDGSGQFLQERMMALSPHHPKSPYPKTTLCRNGIQRSVAVHRLVLEAFVGPCPPGMEACHRDGNHADSRLTNLRWDTHTANAEDMVNHGTHHRDEPTTQCRRGHERTPENTYLHKSGNRVKRVCRVCSRDRYQRTKQRDRQPLTHCRKGLHELTPENTYFPPKGGRECRECRSENKRAYSARRSEERRARSAAPSLKA